MTVQVKEVAGSVMYVERYSLVVPVAVPTEEAAITTVSLDAVESGDLSQAAAAQEQQKLQVFSGKRAVSRYGVEVEGSGASAEGRIKVRGRFHSHRTLYDVYGLPASDRIQVWIFNYSHDSSRSELREAINDSVVGNVDIDLKFRLTGNDFGITSVFVTFEAIRTQIAGVTKDFVTNNSENAKAVSPDGSPYPGGFEPIP